MTITPMDRQTAVLLVVLIVALLFVALEVAQWRERSRRQKARLAAQAHLDYLAERDARSQVRRRRASMRQYPATSGGIASARPPQ